MFNLRILPIFATLIFSALWMTSSALAGMAEHTIKVDDGVYAYGDPA